MARRWRHVRCGPQSLVVPPTPSRRQQPHSHDHAVLVDPLSEHWPDYTWLITEQATNLTRRCRVFTVFPMVSILRNGSNASLARAGVQPYEITDLIFTHLHFDHCGGTTDYVDGVLSHVFPNARYHVHRDHFRTATEPNPREQASFLPDNIGPIAAASDRLSLVDVEQVNSNQPVYEPGLEALVMNGHTLGQQLPKITSGDQHLVFVADLLPTAQHLPLVWVMGYDMFPTQTLKEKQEFLEQAAAEQWWLLMEHDRYHECIQVGNIDGRWKVIANSTLNDLAQ